jgi:WD40 repeat protein
MNAKRMVVAQEKRVDIFDLNTMKFLHSLETPRNPLGSLFLPLIVAFPDSRSFYFFIFTGLLELSSSDQCSTLVVPASDSVGEVFVFDALNLKVVNLIAAHDSPIRAMAISFDGTLLATCSNTGTLVHYHIHLNQLSLYFFFHFGQRFSTDSSVFAAERQSNPHLSSRHSSCIRVVVVVQSGQQISVSDLRFAVGSRVLHGRTSGNRHERRCQQHDW